MVLFAGILTVELTREVNRTNSTSREGAEAYADTVLGTKFHCRINAAGELVFLKSDFTDHTVLQQNGMMKVAGGYLPFTGFHIFASRFDMQQGEPAILTDANQVEIEMMSGAITSCDGFVSPSSQAGDLRCVGLVGSSERIGDVYIVYVAAVGDATFPGFNGVTINGGFSVDDWVVPGSNRDWIIGDRDSAVLRVKGKQRDGRAYCFFV